MNPNNRITYRFDREGQKVSNKEEKPQRIDEQRRKQSPIGNVIPLYQPMASNGIDDTHPWDSVFQEDVGALEKLIRDSDDEATNDRSASYAGSNFSTRADAVEHESGLWKDAGMSDPWSSLQHDIAAPEEKIQEPEYAWSRDHNPVVDDVGPIIRKSGGPSWLNVFLSVAGALATGALFGYFILTLFTGGFMWPGSSANGNGNPAVGTDISLDEIVNLPVTENISQGTGDAGAETPPAEQPGESVAVATVGLGGEHTYSVLQYGAFNGTAGRDEALSQLAAKGLPSATIQSGDSYYVYAGIAMSQKEASVLTSQMPDMLIYKKELELALPDQLAFTGSEEDAKLFFDRTHALVVAWSSLIVTQFEQAELSPVGQAASKAWQDKLGEWKTSAEAMKKGIGEGKDSDYLTKLTDAIGDAGEALLAYDEKTSKASLWKAQENLMRAVLVQKEWFESMSAL